LSNARNHQKPISGLKRFVGSAGLVQEKGERLVLRFSLTDTFIRRNDAGKCYLRTPRGRPPGLVNTMHLEPRLRQSEQSV
jgi:hypothetical protein